MGFYQFEEVIWLNSKENIFAYEFSTEINHALQSGSGMARYSGVTCSDSNKF